jgi:hypothetical protein
MIAIRALQEKPPKDPGPDKPPHTPPSGSRKTTESTITAEIQLNTDPRIIIDPRITTESSSIPSDFIPPNTKVYAVRFDDYENTLAYAVNNIRIFNLFQWMYFFRVQSSNTRLIQISM